MNVTIVTLLCQSAIFVIVFLNILSLHNYVTLNFIRHIGPMVYLFIYYIYFTYCNIIIKNSKSKNQDGDGGSDVGDGEGVSEETQIAYRISKIKQMISDIDKKLILILIPILLTLININANYSSVDREDEYGDVQNSTVNMSLNNNRTIILFALLIVFLNILKLFGILKLISIYNLDYFTLGVLLIFIIQNIFLDDIKTYILLSVFIFYPLIDSFIILSKIPNSKFRDLIKILSEYPNYNNFLTSIPVILLGIIILLMKVFKDYAGFNLVIGTVVLSLIALYHIITILYIIKREFNRSIIPEKITKFKSMMIVCLNETEQSDN